MSAAFHVCISKLSKGGKSYQPNIDHSYKIRKTSGVIVKKYLSQNQLYSPLLIDPLVTVILKTLKCKNKTRNFELLSWIVSMELSSVEFDLFPIQYVEIAKAVKRMKSSASPCPFDHISVLVFKNCPILRTYLHFRFILHSVRLQK